MTSINPTTFNPCHILNKTKRTILGFGFDNYITFNHQILQALPLGREQIG
jgi:hypothetical protein